MQASLTQLCLQGPQYIITESGWLRPRDQPEILSLQATSRCCPAGEGSGHTLTRESILHWMGHDVQNPLQISTAAEPCRARVRIPELPVSLSALIKTVNSWRIPTSRQVRTPASSGSLLAAFHSSWSGEKYPPPLWREPWFPINKGAAVALEPREGEVTGGRGGVGTGALSRQRGAWK